MKKPYYFIYTFLFIIICIMFGLKNGLSLSTFASNNKKLDAINNSENNYFIYGKTLGKRYFLGNSNKYDETALESSFSVTGTNKDKVMWYDWDWMPNDVVYDYYIIDIKNYLNESTAINKDIRIIIFKNEQLISTNGIKEEYVNVDWTSDIVKIKKSAFSTKWSRIDVKFSAGKNLSSPLQSIQYQCWSLNR